VRWLVGWLCFAAGFMCLPAASIAVGRQAPIGGALGTGLHGEDSSARFQVCFFVPGYTAATLSLWLNQRNTAA
jgi:hypothetical protein